MKCLSLSEPMAWAIFNGKDVENRTWPTKYRGRIIIHASKNFNKKHFSWICNQLFSNLILPLPSDFIYGALIGEVDIVDCVTIHGSQWFTGPYGFVLQNAVLYEKPIPYKGKLRLFEVDESILSDKD
jgi:hypothetical protein